MKGGPGWQQAYHEIIQGPCWEQAGSEGNGTVCMGDGRCLCAHTCVQDKAKPFSLHLTASSTSFNK